MRSTNLLTYLLIYSNSFDIIRQMAIPLKSSHDLAFEIESFDLGNGTM